MVHLRDLYNRIIRITSERWGHISGDHPEMAGELEKVRSTLLAPDRIVRSRTDPKVELFYRDFETTLIGRKFLCVVVKVSADDMFMITAYFTDSIKKGEILWERK